MYVFKKVSQFRYQVCIYLPIPAKNQSWTQYKDQAGMKVLERTQCQEQTGMNKFPSVSRGSIAEHKILLEHSGFS